ncbi:MAG: hypothetical protein ACRDRK_27245 [Pseudonocardia sp.]
MIRDQLDETLLPLVALTNFTLSFLLGGLGATVVLAIAGLWMQAAICLGMSVVAALAAYHGALAQASRYADCVRVTFDLYRHDVLKAMHIPLPNTLVAERQRWEDLTQWIYRGEPPQQPVRYEHPVPAAETPPAPPPAARSGTTIGFSSAAGQGASHTVGVLSHVPRAGADRG